MIFPVFSILVDDDFLKNRYIKTVYDSLGFSDKDQFFIAICIFVVGIILLKGIIYVVSRLYQSRFTMEVYEYYTVKMYEQVYKNGFAVLNEKNTNEIIRDISHIPRALSLFIIMPMFVVFSEFVVLFAILGVLTFYYSSLIFIVMIPMITVIYIFYSLVRKRLNYHEEQIHNVVPDNYKEINNMVNAYSDIRLGRKFKFFKSRFENLVNKEKQSRVSLGLYSDMPARVVELGLIISIVIILLYSYFMIDDPSSRLSLLGVFGLAAFRTTPSLNKILTAIVKIKGNLFILDVINKWDPGSKDSFGNDKLVFQNQVSIVDLTVRYGDKTVFENLSFEFKPGEFIGIVGPSGRGKSTLVKVLLGLVEKSSGKIMVDDEELSNQTFNSWYKLVAYVGQDVFLLDDTIAANIGFGEIEIDDQKMSEVLKRSGLDNFVNDLENGVNTVVGENGAMISGGQKQRIGIARALYREPKILILDESTNALDAEIESAIISTIKDLCSNGISILFITHKQDNLVDSDQLINL